MYSKSEQSPPPLAYHPKAEEDKQHQKYKTTEGEEDEDIMLRDTNPYFQDKVEGKVLNHLQNKPGKRDKLINWSIYNSGKQTIIVL